jgi:hypothetical protein
MQAPRKRTGPSILLALCLAFCSQQTSAQTPTGVLSGRVVDQLGGLIVGADITVTATDGAKRNAVTNSEGSFTIAGLTPGKYLVRATARGFAAYEKADVEVAAGRRLQLDIQLMATVESQEITVSSNNRAVSTEAANNAGQIVLGEEELAALPDDSEELAGVLQALAGPSAGPSNSQFYVDGFTAGRLPQKSSIREVRINQNPFSAEFDRVGFGRIEIFTKPGTDKLRGLTYFNFNDESLNSRNPFARRRAPHQLRQFGGNLGGPMAAKKGSYFLDFDRRESDDNALVNATVLGPSFSPTTLNQLVLTPSRRTSFGLRADYLLNPNNTLVARYNFIRSSFDNSGVGDFSLPSRAFDTTSTDHIFQLSETAVLGPRVANETRFQFTRSDRNQEDRNAQPSVVVLDAFSGGGAQVGLASAEESRWEVHNYTTFALGNHTLRVGGRLRGVSIDDTSPSNFGGTFTFAGGFAPQLDAGNQIVRDAAGRPLLAPVTSLERYRRTLLFQSLGLSPAEIRARGGGATQFSIVTGNPQARVSQIDFGGFAQDDWHLRPDLTLNLGLRYETQSNISSRLNFAPRVALAWAPGRGGGKPPRAVIRGAFGVFYDRFSEYLTLQAHRFNGVNEQQFIVSDFVPGGVAVLDAFPNAPAASALSAVSVPQTLRRVAANLQAPYTMQAAFSVERQLPRHLTVSATFITARTLHLLRSRNINAPLPGTFNPAVPGSGVRPLGGADNVYLYESSGRLNQNQLVLTASFRPNRRLLLFGNYALNKANSDTDGADTFPVNQYDLSGEYGRSALDVRHRFFMGGSIGLPGAISLSPFVVALSGRPYNIITGLDTNGDTIFNERPAFASSLSGDGVVLTKFGPLDLTPEPGERLIPRNLGTAPAFFTVNLRVSRSFGFMDVKPSSSAATPTSSAARAATRQAEKRYYLTLAVQVQNLFNRANAGVPVGNLSSPLFGQSISLNPGLRFTGGVTGNTSPAANRRVELQIRFSF